MWVIDAADDGTPWRRLISDDRPEDDYDPEADNEPEKLAVHYRFAPTSDGVAVAGIQIERTDGRALTARDLRTVKLPPNWVLFGEAPRRWYGADGTEINRRRKSARDSDSQHRAVWDLWCQAQQVAPRAPVRWMLPQLAVSDATARRWIKQARERAALRGWPA